MASTINASTSPAAIVQTADGTANLSLQSNGTTIAALTSTGMAVTGTLSASGEATISGLTVGKGGGALASNTAVGYQAINATNTGGNNVGLGYQAALALTSGDSSVAIGPFALSAVTTGTSNIAIGRGAISQADGSSYCVAVGRDALRNTTANENTAVGYQAAYTNTTGTNNGAFGMSALNLNTTGYQNNSFGSYSLEKNTTGYYNTAVGHNSLAVNTTGFNNVALGYTAGGVVTTGSYNTYIGFGSKASSTSVAQEIVIGTFNMTGKGNSTTFISANSGSSYNGANTTTWATISDQRLKKNIIDNTDGLNKITALQIRNFEYRLPEEVTELESQNAIDKQGVQLGVIAQELQQVLPDCVKEESTGVLSVQTDNLVWYLINAIKEQQALITSLTARITALEGA